MPVKVEQLIDPLETAFQNPASDRRMAILAAAEKIFSHKGSKQTPISEIAAEAGIKDSVIYRYFKGKQDILFAVAEERLKEGVVLLDRDLKGLIDPFSRLRKLIWGNLWYNNHYSGYSRLLLFECISSPKFYTSPANAVLEKYISRLTGIFEQGIKEKKFRDDIPLPVMQGLVLGAVNMSIVGFHELQEISNPELDFEDIAFLMDLLFAPPQKPQSSLDKTCMILEAAEKVFAKRSFDRAKMTEIAKLAGVADGTVYEYFKNKDVLLFSLPQRRFQEFKNDLSDLSSTENASRKLKRLIKYYFLNYFMDPDFMRVYVLNLYMNRDFYHSNSFEVYKDYYKLIEEAIVEGKNSGVFYKELNPRIFRNFVVGSFGTLATRWLMDEQTTDINMMKDANIVTEALTQSITVNNY